MIYLDTSVLAAFYCPEPLSAKAERLIRAEHAPALSDLTEVELYSALSRRTREGGLSISDAARIAGQFAEHLESDLYTRLSLQRSHYRAARNWIGRFATPLRTLDALHLAVAASTGRQLVTTDRSLARSADDLGVEVLHLR